MGPNTTDAYFVVDFDWQLEERFAPGMQIDNADVAAMKHLVCDLDVSISSVAWAYACDVRNVATVWNHSEQQLIDTDTNLVYAFRLQGGDWYRYDPTLSL